MAEGLFDDEAGVPVEAGVAEPVGDGREECRRDGEVVGRVLGGRGAEAAAYPGVGGALVVVATQEVRAPVQALEDRTVDVAERSVDRLADALVQLRVVPVAAANAEDRDLQVAALFEAVEGGEEERLGEVPRRAEEHQGTRARPVPLRRRAGSPRCAAVPCVAVPCVVPASHRRALLVATAPWPAAPCPQRRAETPASG